MDFFGHLGIDFRLLTAQLINFGLLLWILAKFVYRPIVDRIERDETTLAKAKREKEQLVNDRKAFKEQQDRDVKTAQSEAKRIVSEANSVAKRAMKRADMENARELAAVLTEAKRRLAKERESLKASIADDWSQQLVDSLQSTLSKTISESLRREFQTKVFLTTLIQDIHSVDLRRIYSLGLGEKEARELFTDKAGPVVLSYAFAPTKPQRAKIEDALKEKLGLLPNVTSHKDQKLASGFRLEVAGTVIESNLLALFTENLRHAADQHD